MPRSKLILDPHSVYHISARSRNKDWYDLPIEKVWQITTENLYFISHAFTVEILSYVLMSNHYHLMARFPLNNQSEAMQRFQRDSTIQIQKESGRVNQVWGSRYFRSRLTSYSYTMNCYKYVYQNPLRAGLVSRVEDYPFSTLHSLIGRSHHLVPTTLETLLFENGVEATLNWLNAQADSDVISDINYGLRFAEFKMRHRNRKPNPWVDRLI